MTTGTDDVQEAAKDAREAWGHLSNLNRKDAEIDSSSKSQQEFTGTLRNRMRIGYTMQIIAGGGIGALLYHGFSNLKEFLSLGQWQMITMCLATVGITAVGGFFLYQLLRAGERLALPYHWVEQALLKDPHLLKSLMGVEDPLSATQSLMKQAQAVMDPLSKIAGVKKPE